jgi:hypothetical protein
VRPITRLLTALAFVGSAGVWFNERHRASFVLITLAGLIALGSTFVLLRDGWNFFLLPVHSTDASPSIDAQRSVGNSASDLKNLDELKAVFDVASYRNGVLIIGLISSQGSKLSDEATKQLLMEVASTARRSGFVVDEFRPAVYSAGYFDTLMNGKVAILSQIGLAQKMRAALLGSVEADCQPASEVIGVTSCTLSLALRVILANGQTSLHRLRETGAGLDTSRALNRAAELILERHTEIFSGV